MKRPDSQLSMFAPPPPPEPKRFELAETKTRRGPRWACSTRGCDWVQAAEPHRLDDCPLCAGKERGLWVCPRCGGDEQDAGKCRRCTRSPRLAALIRGER